MRRGVGIFDLSENLRFPDYHRVQTGGHAEEVAHGILADVLIEMRLEEGAGDGLLFRQQRFNPFVGGVKVSRAGDDLNPITGGQYDTFLDGLGIDQAAQGGFQEPIAESQPFTHFDRCAAMVQPDEYKFRCPTSQTHLRAGPGRAV